MVRQLIEGPVGAGLKFLSLDHNVLSALERRAVADSADYIAAAMPQALAISSREGLWDFAIQHADPQGLWLEFGVFKGYSINYLARSAPGKVFGFDSFQGLEEDWKGVGHAKGTFDLAGRLPRVRPNVSLAPGCSATRCRTFSPRTRSPSLCCISTATRMKPPPKFSA
jgi:hypothetical protein